MVHGVAGLPGARELAPGCGVFVGGAAAAAQLVASGEADADDFAFTVKALQHYDNRLPIHTLIRAAHALYAEDVNSARRVDDAF